MNIYIENLDSRIDEEQLMQLFVPFGDVLATEIVKDVFTGVSRGFGYVQMEEEAARSAIHRLHGFTLHGLTLIVKEAPEKKAQKGSYKVGNGAINVYQFKKN
jgi:RNA recognition motif-containing protein